MTDESKTHLSDQQLARVEALEAVARYVRDSKPMSSGRADPTELIRLAEYVLTGAPGGPAVTDA